MSKPENAGFDVLKKLIRESMKMRFQSIPLFFGDRRDGKSVSLL